MKVGVNEATELKKRSKSLKIPFADLLWGYVIEDLVFRICDSPYGETMWLETYPILGVDAYRDREHKTIRFYFHENEDENEKEKFTAKMADQILMEIFGEQNIWQVHWKWEFSMEHGAAYIRMTAVYCDMDVPVMLAIRPLHGEKLNPGVRQDELPALGGRLITYPVYAPENRLCRDILDIMDRLELISDMESYYSVYHILKSENLSGRSVMDEMAELLEETPRVKKEQRLEQVAGYRSYAYMRKRWDKYMRHHGHEELAWEEVLDLIVRFLKPIWHCLCSDEVFFDDWMPEIGRFI